MKAKLTALLKAKKFYLILLTLFWVYMFVEYNPFDLNQESDGVYPYTKNNYVAGDIAQDTELKQVFRVGKNNLKAVNILLSTYGRKNKGKFSVTVEDLSDGATIARETVKCSKLSDNSYYSIVLDGQEDSAGKQYQLTIKGDNIPEGNEIAYWMGGIVEDEENSGISCSIDSVGVTGAMLTLSYTYSTSLVLLLKITAWLVLVVLSYVFVFLFTGANGKTFLYLSLILGIWTIVLNPFFHPLDESTHFFRSFAISSGQLVDTVTEDGRIGAFISDNYGEITGSELNLKTYFLTPGVWNQPFSGNDAFIENKYMSSVTPVNHAVGAVGILIANLFHMDAIAAILLGRFCDYIFYTVVCYLAIKNMKYYKTVFFALAAFPVSLWLAGSFSIDPILISSCLLFLSICLKYYFEKGQDTKVTRLDMVLILLCGLSIASVKYFVYAPILLMFFFIPRDKFSKKGYSIMLCCAAAIVVLLAGAQLYLLKKIPFVEDRNGDVDVARQIKFMLENKKQVMKLFVEYFVEKWSSFPKSLYHVPAYQPGSTILAFLMSMFTVFCCPFMEPEKYQFQKRKEQISFIAIPCAIYIVVAFLSIAALYVGFTPVGSLTDVEGVQPRYMLPVLLMLMLPISTIKMNNKIKNYGSILAFAAGMNVANMLVGLLERTF